MARTFTVPRVEEITYGPGSFDTLSDIVGAHGGRRPVAIMSGSLAATELGQALWDQFGANLVGVYASVPQHVPRAAVLEAAAMARDGGADSVISIGGGTPIDCAKAVAMCLATGITKPEDFDKYRVRFTYPDVYDVPDIPGRTIPHIAVPTTLSGGEHTGLAGVTDEVTRTKCAYSGLSLTPKAVILDPDVAGRTPAWLWAASGIRAVDHAVEGILSAKSMPMADALGLEALRLLAANLERSTNNPSDTQSRTNCLLASWLSIFGATNVGMGLSHGIGHQLAAQFDITHGITSAIMLPHVMEFNAALTAPQLRRIAEALGRDTHDLDEASAAQQAIAAVRDLVTRLDVTNTISAAGGSRDALPALAEHIMGDAAVAASRRPVSKEDVLALLDAAW
ncbi:MULTISPECIES: iron-containing alcohol dehydrogenase [unclassified Mycobacterium]|uniref:iron-containing alcohol dehydrogenase n=1 Tax=unclassified Mycobacterium TaxID=2642494 RepID=UPI0008000F8D|nr:MULTISPECIES: iron-containing alcohol dehydrogenase [unclassified Mycobacterium]OBH01549.1 lactaldehyde reductase [Mycobacterium sp. E3247]